MTNFEKDYKNEPIAIIGMDCIFPKAENKNVYWRNILNKICAIGDPLPEWDAKRYLENGRITTSKGGYLKDLYRFNPAEFGVTPSSVDGGEPDQLLALQVAKYALNDAGEQYLDKDYNHHKTGVILGHSTYLHRGQINVAQHNIVIDQTIEMFQALVPDINEQQKKMLENVMRSQLPQMTPEICPSDVPNVMTGRIANRFNFCGPNYLIDAACSSSLLAVESAMNELRSGNADLMLAGGVNASLPADVAHIFTMLGALSKKGMLTPFDADSDGTLLGEGLGVVVLKRFHDALRDGDKIYAMIHEIASSSDGRGLGLLAPSEKGEALAIQRVYEKSGIDPQTVSLIEAHGTGIALGDKTEINALSQIFGQRLGEEGHIALGSVKSMISHCIPAAGVAGLIKMAAALHHKILPPTLCKTLNPALEINKTPFFVNIEPKAWLKKNKNPRRAGVDSFGFGGINTHALLEEAPENAVKPLKNSVWNFELFAFSAENIDDLKQQLNIVKECITHRNDILLSDIANKLYKNLKTGDYKLCLIASNNEDLSKKIDMAVKRIDKDAEKPLMGKGGVVYTPKAQQGKVAFMFPGEGSQYLGMLADLALHFEPIREWLSFWHDLYPSTKGSSRTDVFFAPEIELTDEKRDILNKKIHQMDIGSEAVFVAGQALYSLLNDLNVKADVMVGHSSGESSALAASKAIAWNKPEELAEFVRKLNAMYKQVDAQGGIATGVLMAIGLLKMDRIKEAIGSLDIDIAMDNCPNQIIVFGQTQDIEQLKKTLSEKGAICEILPFDRGYHTPKFTPMQKAFADYYSQIDLNTPKVPLYSCATTGLFENDKDRSQELAARQWADTVRFTETVQTMYNDGIRYFIEVGPDGKLASFAEQILKQAKMNDVIVSASNLAAKSGLDQLLHLIAKLFVNNKVGLEKLFEGRYFNDINLLQLEKPRLKGMLLNNTLPRLYATEEFIKTAKEILFKNNTQITLIQQQNSYPFLHEILLNDGQKLNANVNLSVNEMRFLQDHILSGQVSENPALYGLSCVPMMVTLEIMAEASATLLNKKHIVAIEKVQAFDWIALDNGYTQLYVQAQKIDKISAYVEIFHQNQKVMQANFIFEQLKNTHCVDVMPLQNPQSYSWSEPYQAYKEGMFHGPIFQSLPLIAGWDLTGIDGKLSNVSLNGFFVERQKPNFVLNPVLLDALGQLTAFWIAEQIGTDFNSFPSSIECIEFYTPLLEKRDDLYLSGRLENQQIFDGNMNAMPSWNFQCIDVSGQIHLRVKGLKSVFFPVPHEFYQCRYNPYGSFLGSPTQDENGNFVWSMQSLQKDFTAQSNAIFMRMLAHIYLSANERGLWKQLAHAAIEQKRNWLFTYISIKEAARYYIYTQTNRLLYASDIEVNYQNDQYNVYGYWSHEESFIFPEFFTSLFVQGEQIFVKPINPYQFVDLAA